MDYSLMTKEELIKELVKLQQNLDESRGKEKNALNPLERFKLMVENAGEIVSLHNLHQLEYIYINPVGLTFFGYSIEDLIGKSAMDFIHPDDQELIHKEFERGLDKGRGAVECRYRKKDGSYVWTSVTGKIISDGIQPPLALIVKRDISGRKEAEEALRISEARYRAVVEEQTELICRFLADTTLIFVNEAYCRYFNMRSEELLGKSFLSLVPEDEHAKIKSYILSLNPEFPGSTYSHQVIRHNGEIAWQEWNDRAIFDSHHSLIEIQSVGRDITERKQAEEALERIRNELEKRVKERTVKLSEANEKLRIEIAERRQIEDALKESEAQFRTLAETNPAMIFLHAGEKYCYVNPAFQEISGFTEEECLKMNFWDVAHPDYQNLLKNYGHARMRGEKVPPQYEFKLLSKNGCELWVEVFAGRIEFKGKAGIIGAGFDRTTRRATEQEIKFLSFHDSLTGLHNRLVFEEKLKELDSQKHLPLSLIIGDVNGLKLVNDALGSKRGDMLLKRLAWILRDSCAAGDIIARLGGDEFGIILVGGDKNRAAKTCEYIRNACNNTDDFPIQISISLGLAIKEEAHQNIRELMREAENRMYRNKLLESKSARSSFITSLEEALWTKSHETEAHCRRLKEMAAQLGQAIGLTDSEQDNLTLLAALHDIGKIAIPNEILEKVEPLSPDEWEVIKKHPETGYRIALALPELAPIANAVLTHHERWDGNGYPLGLRGDKIPHISRILSIVDTYDVMVNGRPYRRGVSHHEALDEIKSCAGTQFDPELVKIFLEIMFAQRED